MPYNNAVNELVHDTPTTDQVSTLESYDVTDANARDFIHITYILKELDADIHAYFGKHPDLYHYLAKELSELHQHRAENTFPCLK